MIAGNFIGTNRAGTGDRGNTLSGIGFTDRASNNTIGGTTAGARNVISGNDGNGILLSSANVFDNTIAGNYIGTNAAGTAAIANANGVQIAGAAIDNTIGGTTAAARNVISGNTGTGVSISDTGSDGNTISGNYIGTTAAGDAALGNDEGVFINGGTGTLIGGLTAGARNVISGNIQRGIVLTADASANTVQGNFIGTDASGTLPLGNGGAGGPDHAGIRVAGPGNTIGGTAPGAGNVIADSGTAGIHLVTANSVGNVVQGNWIGTNSAGAVGLGNRSTGLTIQNGASGNLIGGTAPGAGNVIAGNATDGVRVGDAVTINNSIRVNSIYANGELGIDLGNDGVTANDAADADAGPNGRHELPGADLRRSRRVDQPARSFERRAEQYLLPRLLRLRRRRPERVRGGQAISRVGDSDHRRGRPGDRVGDPGVGNDHQ